MATWIDTKDPADITANLDSLRALDPDTSAGRLWAEHVRYAGSDLRFALWLLMVDRRFTRRFGLGIYNMPDWTWRDAYDSGMSPAEATASATEDFSGDLDLF